MNKLKARYFYFLFVFFNSVAAAPEHEESLRVPAIDLSNSALEKLCLKQATALEKALIQVLDRLFICKQYWQKQQIQPSYTVLPNSIHEWFYGKSVNTVFAEAIKQIDSEINKNADALGNVQFKKNQLINCAETDKFDHIEKFTLFISKILNGTKETKAIEQSSPIVLHALILKQLTTIEEYPTHCLQSLSKYSLPGHFKQNWGKYTVAGLIAVAVSYYALKSPAQFQQLLIDSKEALQDFYKTRILVPLQNTWDVIFKKRNRILMPGETAQTEVELYEKRVSDYLHKRNKSGWFKMVPESEKLSAEEIKKIAREAAEKRQIPPIIREDLAKQSQNPLWNIGAGEMADLELLEMRQLKVIAMDLVLMVNDLAKANDLTWELIPILPVAGLSYVTYKIGSKYYWSLINKPIKKAVRNIETLLTDNSQEPYIINATGHGFIYFWICKISSYAKFISASEQLLLKQDLEQLASLNYNLHQKKEIIARMYHSYKFLSPYN